MSSRYSRIARFGGLVISTGALCCAVGGPAPGSGSGAASATASELGSLAAQKKVEKIMVYVGTYTQGGKSKGIYLLEMDPDTGKLTPKGAVAEVANPSFLAIHPNRRYLYAVGEIADFAGKKSGAVTAFSIDGATGALTLLNQQPSVGAGPCHLVVDGSGKNVLVANYGGGSVAALPVETDGRLREPSAFIQHEGKSVNPRRQEAPHAHSINVDRANRFAFAADLGLDKVLIYRLDSSKGTLSPNDPPAGIVPPGSGPRHFAFHPTGRYAYVINEISSTVTAFAYDSKSGALNPLQTLTTLPADYSGGGGTAEVQVHPSGKFLYGSNRGHDTIAIFTINAETGRLTPAGHQLTGGKTPRNFGIDPTGAFLLAANQNSDTIVVFRIDAQTGALAQAGQQVEVPSPVCVKFLTR